MTKECDKREREAVVEKAKDFKHATGSSLRLNG